MRKEKKMNKIGRFTVTASIVSLLLAPAAFAGQELDSQKEIESPQTHEQAPSSPMERDQETLKPSAPTELTGQRMPGGKAPLFKASKLIGYSVKNKQGEEVGEIEEVVINSQDGRIAYAVLSFGGFLGMGDKLFAIPWKSLTPIPEQQSFSLDIDKEKLAETPGFDDTNWPDTAPRE
jgi:sporulation protein YlmC with PRC-barrel domain